MTNNVETQWVKLHKFIMQFNSIFVDTGDKKSWRINKSEKVDSWIAIEVDTNTKHVVVSMEALYANGLLSSSKRYSTVEGAIKRIDRQLKMFIKEILKE